MTIYSTQLSTVLPLSMMKRSGLGIVSGAALISMLMATLIPSRAIAQTELQPIAQNSPEADASPTDNAGSADLVTEPASTSLIQLVEIQVPTLPIEDTEEEINQKTPERLMERPERYGEPGPAQPDRVEFLLE